MLSTNIEILKSWLSKYEVAELHIEHYTSISFYAIFIRTYALLINIYIDYIWYILAVTTDFLCSWKYHKVYRPRKYQKRKEKKKPFLQRILLESCPYSTSPTRYNKNEHSWMAYVQAAVQHKSAHNIWHRSHI